MGDLEALHKALDVWTDTHQYDDDTTHQHSVMCELLWIVVDALEIRDESKETY